MTTIVRDHDIVGDVIYLLSPDGKHAVATRIHKTANLYRKRYGYNNVTRERYNAATRQSFEPPWPTNGLGMKLERD